MKPLYIHIKNIGPFIDEQLDFTQLEKVFLLCGDTGAGKTTIFDAMTFALYGEFLGSRKNKAKDFRSQFATEDDESFVELEFISDEEKYKVFRTLPRAYVNRNKKNDLEPSKVTLEIWNKTNKKYESLNANKNEINAKLIQIIGLNAPEFSKIVVLPQGEFSEFLRSNSKEKQIILKKLFPIDFYQSIVEKVKIKNDELQKKINIADAEIKTLLNEVDFSCAEDKLKDYDENIKTNKNTLNDFYKKKEEFDKEKTILEADLKTALELEESIKSKNDLEEKTSYIENIENKLLLSEEAENIFPFIDVKNKRKEEVDIAKKYLENIIEKKDIAQEKFLQLKKNENQNKKLENQVDENKILLQNYKDKFEVAEKYLKVFKQTENVKNNLDAIKNELLKKEDELDLLKENLTNIGKKAEVSTEGSFTEILKFILEKYSKTKDSFQLKKEKSNKIERFFELQEKISSSKKSILELTEKKDECVKYIENNKKLLAEYLTIKDEQTANNIAVSLVSYLKKDSPCPVCGSTEHPFPAKVSKEFLDINEKIETIEYSINSANENLSKYIAEISAENKIIEKYKEEISSFKMDGQEKNLEKIKKDLDKLQEEMKKLSDLSESCEKTIKKIEDAKIDIFKLKDKVSNAESECASLVATLKSLEERINKNGSNNKLDEIKKDIENLESLLKEQQSQVESYKKEFEESILNFESLKAKHEEATNSFEIAKNNFTESNSILESKLKDSQFENENNVIECFIEKSEKNIYQSRVKAFRDEQVNLLARINVLSKKGVENFSILQKKKEKIESEISLIKNKIEEVSFKLELMLTEKTRFEKDYEKFKKKSKELAQLEHKGKPLAKLWEDLSGANPSKIPFETWFLGLYFDDVVVCANRHLLKISGERYEFILDTDKSGGNSYHGLDLVVHDYQVNKDRDTATLSGGETFMASISLALGLTEVVQKTSKLDSLFIDEGFGSLDNASLEMAVGILQDIGNTRTVGVISHVEEMLDAIACHVHVQKTKKGSHILL